MIIALASQFHIHLPWGQHPFTLCLNSVLNVKVSTRGPSRGLLRDYEPSDGPSFQALSATALSAEFLFLILHNISTPPPDIRTAGDNS